MSHELIAHILRIDGIHQEFGIGSNLFNQGDYVQSLFIVKNGRVDLTRFHKNGSSIVLQQATAGTILAEASIYFEHYHCGAIVAAKTSVLTVPKAIIAQELKQNWEFSYLWAKHLAKEVQTTRFHLENIAQKTVAERLDSWLSWHNCSLPPKGEWKSLASQLAVSPEALYRELSKRKRHSVRTE